METHAVAPAAEIQPGHGKVFTIGEMEIGIFAVAAGYRAYLNLCPHAGAPVCRGEVTPAADLGGTAGAREILRCPWHAWEFDLATGEHLANPACRLRSFPIEVVDGWLTVSI